ncbi:hypothetical protein A8B75_12355 [Sphingomonadales bacterium EhC05]|jgi:hypothetical protein|nr:hypothetical protein A8B75_12355 [Sphingomonadales bacterium EhC05]
MAGNVTIDPRAWAEAVKKPAIQHVRSLKSGLMLDVRRLIGSFRYQHAILLRQKLKSQMKANESRFSCATCGVPVYLACSTSKRFFFRHRHEDGSCPAITRSSFTEADIRAMQYRGAQESKAHKRVKELLIRSLAADARFLDQQCEKTWRASEGLAGLRRPDVSARIDSLRLAFEVQLSTTFLDVVLSRREFYRSERAALLWIVPNFHPSYRRMTDDDILFGNNSNIFVVDDASVAASEHRGRLMFTCWYRKPRVQGDEIVDDWIEELVEWDDLEINLDQQTVCAFNYIAAETALNQQIRENQLARAAETEQAAIREQEARDQRLREQAFNLVSSYDERDDYIIREQDWLDLNRSLTERECGLNSKQPDYSKLARMVSLIETARNGRPIGFGYGSLAEIAHHLFHQHPDYLFAFGHLLDAFGTKAILDRDDRTGKWKMKVAKERETMRSDPKFKMPEDEELLLAFLSGNRSRSTLANNDSSNTDRKLAA